MMGKDIIIKEISKQAKVMLGAGILGFLVFGGYALFNIMNGNYSSLTILCAVCSLICIVCIIMGIVVLIHPEKSFAIRSNPEIFDMAEEHFSNIRFKNNYITLSDRMISASDNPASVSYMNEVFWVYIERHKTNFVTTSKNLVFETARGRYQINIMNVSDNDIEYNIIRYFTEHCPYAAIGYSNDNMAYRDRMKNEWKQNHMR